MVQAMRDVDQINKHLEQFIKPASKPASAQSRPQTKPFEVFEDDKDKSRVSIKEHIEDLAASQTIAQREVDEIIDAYEDSEEPSDATLSDSQINEALNILNDPLALSLAVREQYNQVARQEDASFLNPLAQGDDSRLNVTTKYYQKQQVYAEPPQFKRPASPLIDRAERDRLWNCG